MTFSFVSGVGTTLPFLAVSNEGPRCVMELISGENTNPTDGQPPWSMRLRAFPSK